MTQKHTLLTEEQPETSTAVHSSLFLSPKHNGLPLSPKYSGLSLSPEHSGPSYYDSWEDTGSDSEEEIRDGNIDSLEHLNIIQLGNKLGSKIIREYYPKHLIKRTALTPKEIPCSFAEDNEFYSSIFDTLMSRIVNVYNDIH
ncbi:unnamed protein product [Rhizopus stolonifer]